MISDLQKLGGISALIEAALYVTGVRRQTNGTDAAIC